MSIEQKKMDWDHSHDFFELVYVRKGSGLHRHNRKKYPITKGDCFIILPGEDHTYVEDKSLRITDRKSTRLNSSHYS